MQQAAVNGLLSAKFHVLFSPGSLMLVLHLLVLNLLVLPVLHFLAEYKALSRSTMLTGGYCVR